jgi:anti-sigma B factor antagonist
VDLKLGHYNKDGIEVVDAEGEIDVYTAPRLRELLIDLVNKNNYQLVVNMEKVEFLDSTGLGVLVGAVKRVRAHDGSLDLVFTQERILKIFRITGLTKVFGIYETVDQAIAAKKSAKLRRPGCRHSRRRCHVHAAARARHTARMAVRCDAAVWMKGKTDLAVPRTSLPSRSTSASSSDSRACCNDYRAYCYLFKPSSTVQ